MRAERTAAVDLLAEEAARWKDVYRSWRRAVDTREREGERMDRQVMRAAGGLSVARFEAVCRRHCIRTVKDETQKARAIRARPAVEAAAAARDQARAVADADVLAARIALANQSKVMLRFGMVGHRMVGQTTASFVSWLASRRTAQPADGQPGGLIGMGIPGRRR